jgi:hypothetical protein
MNWWGTFEPLVTAASVSIAIAIAIADGRDRSPKGMQRPGAWMAATTVLRRCGKSEQRRIRPLVLVDPRSIPIRPVPPF